MAEDELVELTYEQLGDLVRLLLGPPEEWDDVAVDFVLRVYGIDPEDAGTYVKRLLDNIVREKREKGEPIPKLLNDCLQAFNQEPPEHSIPSSKP